MKIQRIYLIFIAILLMVEGCSSEKSQNAEILTPTVARAIPEITPTASKLIPGNICEAPCWNNLTPGRSSKQEVDLFLNNVNPESWYNYGTSSYPSGCKSFRLTDVNNVNVSRLVDLFVDHDSLILIEYAPPTKITLSEVVNRFGDPQYVRPLQIDSTHGPFYDLTVFYPNKGLAFKIDIRGYETGKISPEMKVQYYTFFQAGSITDYFIARYSCEFTKEIGPEMAKSEVANHILPWSGFGEINPIETY